MIFQFCMFFFSYKLIHINQFLFQLTELTLSGGARQKIFRRFAPDRCPHFRPGPVPVTFKFVPVPLMVQITRKKTDDFVTDNFVTNSKDEIIKEDSDQMSIS